MRNIIVSAFGRSTASYRLRGVGEFEHGWDRCALERRSEAYRHDELFESDGADSQVPALGGLSTFELFIHDTRQPAAVVATGWRSSWTRRGRLRRRPQIARTARARGTHLP
jgi:hypothetical protein